MVVKCVGLLYFIKSEMPLVVTYTVILCIVKEKECS